MIENNTLINRTESLNTQCHIEELPPEIIYEIFKHLSRIEIVKMSQLNKNFYVLANYPYLPQFRWVLTSPTIQKLETEKDLPLIQYDDLDRAFIPEKSYLAVMNSYVKRNYLKEIKSSKNKNLLYLCLDSDANNKKAIVEFLKTCRDSKDETDWKTGEFLAKNFAIIGLEGALEILFNAYIAGGFGFDKKNPENQSEGQNFLWYSNEPSETEIKYRLMAIHDGLLGFDISAYNQEESVKSAERRHVSSYEAVLFLLNIYKNGDLNHDPSSPVVKKKAQDLLQRLSQSDNVRLRELAETYQGDYHD